ncbi:hypothetical protein SCANM124S_08892 [Streptomyces canus]
MVLGSYPESLAPLAKRTAVRYVSMTPDRSPFRGVVAPDTTLYWRSHPSGVRVREHDSDDVVGIKVMGEC